MLINKPLLPPKAGFVEVDMNGKRMYKNVQTGKILDPDVNPTPLTHEEINQMVVSKIREKYDINEEFKMINLGISDPTNKDYIAYREYVTSCIAWGDDLFLETEAGEDINE